MTLEEARKDIQDEYYYELMEQFNQDIFESLESKYDIIIKIDEELLEEK